MALATKDPDNDEKLNPGAWDESTGSRLSAAEQGALADIENNYDTNADSSAENANIDKARDSEARGNKQSVVDKGSENSPKKSRSNEIRDSIGNKKDKLSLSFMKKKGPLALIGLLLGGGGGMFVALLSPGLAIVQLKEALSEDLNDSVAAMDERAQHIFRAQTKKQTGGLCTRKVTVRCNYRTMSERQVKKLARSGITISSDTERVKTPTGRHRVTSFSFVDSDGTPRTITAENFSREYRDNPHFRSLMNRYYSPRWMSVRDAAADSVKKKFKLNFHRLINGKTKAEMQDQMDRTVREGSREFNGKRVMVIEREVDGENRKVYVDADDPDGPEMRDSKNMVIDPDAAEKQMQDLRKQAGGSARSKLTIGLSAANLYTGTAETYCMITKTIRMASMAARNIKYAQYMRYAIQYANTADSIALGTATPEATEFLGDILSRKDLRDKVLSEASIPTDPDGAGGAILSGITQEEVSVVPEDNPHKGKDALDATAVKASMYGGGATLDMRESEASLGGGMGSVMAGYIKAIFGSLAPGERQCAFWTNPIVQGGGLVLSVATLVLTGGSSAAVQGAKAVGVTAATMLVMHILTSRITEMIEGNTVSSDSYGVDAGNAIFSGTAAFNGSTASARGMTPLSTMDEIKENNRVAHEEQQRHTEVARLEAAGTPFDIHNQYSFLGSMAWSLAPVARASSDTVASIALSPIRFLSVAPNWFMPRASAKPIINESRFDQCSEGIEGEDGVMVGGIFDEDNLNVDTPDIMCNLRFGLSETQRNADPEKIAQWMVDSCQIHPETGEVNMTGRCPTGCAPGEGGGENCHRTTNPEEAVALLNAGPEQIANAMRYDDEGIDRPIASDTTVPAEQASIQNQLPKEINPAPPSSLNGVDPRSGEYAGLESEETQQAVTEDVRTYAHFLRYCRYGPEDGRTVNFGDPDIELDAEGNPVEGNILTGLPLIGEAGDTVYSSIGKECFTSNNCDPTVDDPREGTPGVSDLEAQKFCRPPQYDIYSVFTLDQAVLGGLDMEEEASQGQDSGGASTGDFEWPMAGDNYITSCFAPRGGSFHGALDISGSGNPEIIAADGGEVVMVRNGDGSPSLGGFGESVVIKHDNGYYTRYSHMTSGSIVVKEGDKVDKGEKLGIQGNTGISFGAHLDFGISKNMPPYNNNSENPLNHMEIPSHVNNQAGCAAD